MKNFFNPVFASKRWHFSIVIFSLVVTTGCSTTNGRVDHSVRVSNTGDEEIVDFRYTYGELGSRTLPRLGLGGDGVTKQMRPPEVMQVAWTTEKNGKQYELIVPLKARLAHAELAAKTISVEVNGARLNVFLEERLPHFQKKRIMIYDTN